MPITYSKATSSDAGGFAYCQINSFINDRFYQACFGLTPNSTPEAIQQNIDFRIKRWTRRLNDPNIHWIKATDESTGTIVGISGWEVPKARRSTPTSSEEDQPQQEWPSTWSKEFLDQAEQMVNAKLTESIGETDHLWYVAIMAVPPSYCGQGIGQQLMKLGIELADQAGEGMYLESTPVAKKLYERNGFETMAVFELPEGYWSDIMLRKPRS